MGRILLLLTLWFPSLLGEPVEEFKNFKNAWAGINDYTCIIESYIRKGEKEEIRTYDYRFMKPGWVRMKIIKGDNKGAVVVYNPTTKKVRARKGGILGVVKLTFDPTHKRVVSIRGHRVDRSHFGAILERWEDYFKRAEVEYKGVGDFEGKEGFLFEALNCDTLKYHGTYRELLWLDKNTHLPMGFEQYDEGGTLIHRVIYREIKWNVGLNEEDFKL
jgi:outer membrane lipoprotein-sorting protein